MDNEKSERDKERDLIVRYMREIAQAQLAIIDGALARAFAASALAMADRVEANKHREGPTVH